MGARQRTCLAVVCGNPLESGGRVSLERPARQAEWSFLSFLTSGVTTRGS